MIAPLAEITTGARVEQLEQIQLQKTPRTPVPYGVWGVVEHWRQVSSHWQHATGAGVEQTDKEKARR